MKLFLCFIIFSTLFVLALISSTTIVLVDALPPVTIADNEKIHCENEIAIEHLFFDLKQFEHHKKFDDEDVEHYPYITPVSLKLKCKGSGCPNVNGTKVILHRVPGHYLKEKEEDNFCEVPVYVEETSGWLLFWLDESWTKPLIAKSVSNAEKRQGYVYVSGKMSGTMRYNCVF